MSLVRSDIHIMDPKEWQRLADEVAAEVGSALDQLEADFWPEPKDPSFRSFWPVIKAQSERVRTAPAIDIEVKLSLSARIRHMTKRARQDQEEYFKQHRQQKQELLAQVASLRERALETNSAETVRALRQELMGLRDEVGSLELPTRADRQEVWDTWQAASQDVWRHLNQLWSTNETELTSILDEAQTRLNSGNVREARDLVRRFNVESHEREASHKALRGLRARANTLWREADEVAKAKHEAYMAEAPEKVERWREVRGRNSRAIARIRGEIDDLQRGAGQSGIAAAFAKAMIEDKMRELERLEDTNDSLEDRIEHTEATLSSVG
jgi:hypothetical protein